MDKRRAEESGSKEPLNRIKKDLLLEVQSLQPADRVVLIGCTNDPQSCTKKDGEALLAAFDKHFYIPLPNYATRQARSSCAARYAFPGMTVTYSTGRFYATVRLRNEAAHMLKCAERQARRHCQRLAGQLRVGLCAVLEAVCSCADVVEGIAGEMHLSDGRQI